MCLRVHFLCEAMFFNHLREAIDGSSCISVTHEGLIQCKRLKLLGSSRSCLDRGKEGSQLEAKDKAFRLDLPALSEG